MLERRNQSNDEYPAITRRSALRIGAVTVPLVAGMALAAKPAHASNMSKVLVDYSKQQPSRFSSMALSAVATNRSDLVAKTYRPDSTTTGLLPGWVKGGLTVRNGDWVVTVAGSVIQNTLINGRLIIRAANVTVSNCWIQGPPAPTNANQALVDCTSSLCQNFVIRDSVLAPQKPTYGWNGISGHDYTAIRLNMYWTVDGGRVYNGNIGMRNSPTRVTFSGCWIHDLSLFSPDPNHSDKRTHNDGIQIEGGSGTRIIGCRLEGYLALSWPGMVKATSDPTTNAPNVWASPHPYSASGRCVTASCIQITPNVGAVTDLVIDGNWLYGGAVGINAANGSPHAGGRLGTWTSNKFDRTQGIQSSGGDRTFTIAYGTKYTLVHSGNVYMDTGRPVLVRANQKV